MNKEQVLSLLRIILQVGGTLASTLGWISSDQVAALTASILAAVGPVMVAAGTIWSIVARTKSSMVASVSAMPETDSKKLEQALDDPMLKQAAKEAATEQVK